MNVLSRACSVVGIRIMGLEELRTEYGVNRGTLETRTAPLGLSVAESP